MSVNIIMIVSLSKQFLGILCFIPFSSKKRYYDFSGLQQKKKFSHIKSYVSNVKLMKSKEN